MAKKKKKTAKRSANSGSFKPGNQASKGKGRTPVPGDIKTARTLNKTELERILNKFLNMNVTELKAIAKHPSTSVLEVMLANIAAKAITQGDQVRLDFLLNRTIGKVKEQIQHSGEIGNPLTPYFAMSNAEKAQLRKDIKKRKGGK